MILLGIFNLGISCAVFVLTCFVMCVCVCMCVECVYVWVLLIGLLVFAVFCIFCTVFFVLFRLCIFSLICSMFSYGYFPGV